MIHGGGADKTEKKYFLYGTIAQKRINPRNYYLCRRVPEDRKTPEGAECERQSRKKRLAKARQKRGKKKGGLSTGKQVLGRNRIERKGANVC